MYPLHTHIVWCTFKRSQMRVFITAVPITKLFSKVLYTLSGHRLVLYIRRRAVDRDRDRDLRSELKVNFN
jgi:hypothetical protein